MPPDRERDGPAPRPHDPSAAPGSPDRSAPRIPGGWSPCRAAPVPRRDAGGVHRPARTQPCRADRSGALPPAPPLEPGPDPGAAPGLRAGPDYDLDGHTIEPARTVQGGATRGQAPRSSDQTT